MKALFDTNILIDYLKGVDAARQEIESYEVPLISAISWMEVMVGVSDAKEEQSIRGFLRYFDLVEITEHIREKAVQLRREHNLRLPDAIILATAELNDALLITRDTKDFKDTLAKRVRVPY